MERTENGSTETIKTAGLGIWELDFGASSIHISSDAQAILGLSEEDARLADGERLEKNFYIVHLRRLMASIDSGVLLWKLADPNGGAKWVRAHIQSENSAVRESRSARLFGSIERVDQLEESRSKIDLERRLSLALEAGDMAIWDFEVSTKKLTASSALNQLLGLPSDAPVSLEDVQAGIFPEDRERISQIAREAIGRGDKRFEVEYRSRRKDAKVRWMLLRAELLFGEDKRLHRVVGVLRDVTPSRSADDTNAYLAAVVSSSADAIVTFERSREILTWNEAAERIFGYSKEQAIGRSFDMLLPDHAIRSARDPLEHVWAGEVAQFEGERRRQDGTLFNAAITAAPVRAPNGLIVSVVVTVRDATTRKNNERRQNLLVRELHHRVRNILATVQAIAGASARYASSLDEFRETFSLRISSLAQAHAILTEDNWQLVDFRKLLLLELRSYVDLDRISLDGPETVLDARTAIPIGMAIHELTTNATKYGALSTDSGRLEITWAVFGAGEEREIDFSWRESGGPPVKAPKHQGFGSLLLTKILKMQLDAEVESDFSPTGFCFRLRAALREPAR